MARSMARVWALPKGWKTSVRSAVLSVISLARYSMISAHAKVGIQTALPRRMPVETSVFGNGVIGYDQTRYAQLSSRVVGTVWRVERTVGELVRRGDVLAIVESFEVGKAKSAS